MAKKKYALIPNYDNVVRRCGYQVIERDHATKQVVGLYPQAMRLRSEEGENYLSVNWLEQCAPHCASSKTQRLKAIVSIHRAKANSRLSPESGVAVLQVGAILGLGAQRGRRLFVRHARTRNDPTHCRINGLPLDNSDAILLSLLATEAYKDFILLKGLDALP